VYKDLMALEKCVTCETFVAELADVEPRVAITSQHIIYTSHDTSDDSPTAVEINNPSDSF